MAVRVAQPPIRRASAVCSRRRFASECLRRSVVKRPLAFVERALLRDFTRAFGAFTTLVFCWYVFISRLIGRGYHCCAFRCLRRRRCLPVAQRGLLQRRHRLRRGWWGRGTGFSRMPLRSSHLSSFLQLCICIDFMFSSL